MRLAGRVHHDVGVPTAPGAIVVALATQRPGVVVAVPIAVEAIGGHSHISLVAVSARAVVVDLPLGVAVAPIAVVVAARATRAAVVRATKYACQLS